MRRAVPLLLAALLTALAAAGPVEARTIKPLPRKWQKGMNVAAFRWNDFSGSRFRYWMRRLKLDAHADTAIFTTRWIQYWKDPLRSDDLTATDISPAYGTAKRCDDHPRSDYTRCQTPTLASEARAIRYARSLGLKTGIKPLVDVGRNPSSGTDRKWIDFSRDAPAQQRWFESYRYMLAQYARMARDQRVDVLVIGTGLTKMTDDPIEQAQWRQIIRDLRSGELMADDKGGYEGIVTYGARWDSIYSDAGDTGTHQFFWDDLDFIGIEGFWPLVNGNDPEHDNPSVSKLRQGWTTNFLAGGRPPGVAVRSLYDEYRKPVVLTGLGYLSRGGTSADPSKGDYAQAAAGGTVQSEPQARAYRAAFDFWDGVARQGGWFQGIYWWNWLPKLGTVKNNGDYTPQGKPAEVELCRRQLGRATRDCVPSRMPAR